MSLLSRVILPDLGAEPESEDILSAHLEHLFSDYTPNAHGDPGSLITYRSSRFGNLTLQIPTQPSKEKGRLLFAHHLWNAALVAAEAIESASNDIVPRDVESFPNDNYDSWRNLDWERKYWDVREANVLELGAGTALPSIISLLSGAASVTITDHPSSAAVTTDTISKNISQNLKQSIVTMRAVDQSTMKSSTLTPTALSPHVFIYGYAWGTTSFYEATPPSPLPSATNSHQNLILSAQQQQNQPKPDSFDRILIADCLWMPSQHSAILNTIQTYLKPNSVNSHAGSAKSIPSALVIAGYHMGRGIAADFFRLITNYEPGSNANHVATKLHRADEQIGNNKEKEQASSQIWSKLAIAEIFEVDIDGRQREWILDREERSDEDKRWCVCAVIVKTPM